MNLFYCLGNRLRETKVRFRLLTARDDLSECRMIYWKRSEPERRWTQPLMLRAQDQTSAEWLAEVTRPEEIHYLKYFFFLKNRQGGEAYYCEHGFSEREPQTGFFELLQVNPGDVPCPPGMGPRVGLLPDFPGTFLPKRPASEQASLGRLERPAYPGKLSGRRSGGHPAEAPVFAGVGRGVPVPDP